MTATDYRQLHQCVTRCVAEMRGIAARLYLRDGAAAELVSKTADELMAMIGRLQPHRIERDERMNVDQKEKLQ